MLKEKAESYYLSGYNCAECILRAANDLYALGLDENALHLVSGFGGGMQVGDACGALCGSISVISRQLVKTKAHDTASLQPMIQKMVSDFEAQFHTIRCREIKPQCFDPDTRCLKTVHIAADILEKIITQWKEKNL